MTIIDAASSSPLLPDAPSLSALVFAMTDVGQVREHNEDAFLVADLDAGRAVTFGSGAERLAVGPHGVLFMVADGMGGAASGEIASAMAGASVLDALRAEWQTVADPTPERFAAALRDATMLANYAIHRLAQDEVQHRGMGTTATVAGLLGHTLYIAQVGDSRAYLIRDQVATQLTKDQSLMQRLVDAGEITLEQAEASEHRNIILQALGPEAMVSVDLTHQSVCNGDLLVLCSDGLSGLVRAEEMGALAATTPDIPTFCAHLVQRANVLGGPDNITVVAVRFDGETRDGHDTPVAYRTYPLAGTMYHQSAGDGTATPAVGVTAVAPRDAGDHRDQSRDVLAARERQARPVFWALGALLSAAVLWLVWRLR